MAEKQIWMRAVARNGLAILDAPLHLRQNKEVVLAAVRCEGRVLRYFDTFQADMDVVSTAVHSDPFAVRFADMYLKKSKDLALSAVQGCGSTLKFFPDFTNDRDCSRTVTEPGDSIVPIRISVSRV